MEGLITIPSEFGPQETMGWLRAVIEAHGLGIFTRINHAELAEKAGLALLADRSHSFRQSPRRHAVNAGKSNDWH